MPPMWSIRGRLFGCVSKYTTISFNENNIYMTMEKCVELKVSHITLVCAKLLIRYRFIQAKLAHSIYFYLLYFCAVTLQWRNNERDGVSNHRRLDYFRRRSKKTSKLRVTGLCEGNSLVTAQRASNVGNVSIWWRHYDLPRLHCMSNFVHSPNSGHMPLLMAHIQTKVLATPHSSS